MSLTDCATPLDPVGQVVVGSQPGLAGAHKVLQAGHGVLVGGQQPPEPADLVGGVPEAVDLGLDLVMEAHGIGDEADDRASECGW